MSSPSVKQPSSKGKGHKQRSQASQQPVKTVSGKSSHPSQGKSFKALKPLPLEFGKEDSVVSTSELRKLHMDRLFLRRVAGLNRDTRLMYERNWGKATVDQGLPDDPGPINAIDFGPVRRWVSLYRTPEEGQDGTKIVNKNAVDQVLGLTSASNANRWVLRELHIWIAPNVVSTHFSALLILPADTANGMVGGSWTDIAPWGEFVKFRVRFHGEGFVSTNTDSIQNPVFSIGGSQKWNAQVYGHFETFD